MTNPKRNYQHNPSKFTGVEEGVGMPTYRLDSPEEKLIKGLRGLSKDPDFRKKTDEEIMAVVRLAQAVLYQVPQTRLGNIKVDI